MPLRVSTTTGEIKGIFFVMEVKEIWKYVPGYEGLYQASNLGSVKSLDRLVLYSDGSKRIHKGRILSASVKIYKKVQLTKDKKVKDFLVHQLVAMAFLGHIPCGLKRIVDHINNDKLDNRVENLQITTVRVNNSKDQKNKTSKYTGVHWYKQKKCWRATVCINRKNIHLGNFENEYDAYLEYKKAVKKYETN